MTSALFSKNLLELDAKLSSSNTPLKNVNSSPSLLAATGGNRKRRRAPAHLSRINLVAPFSHSDLSGSSESLNSGTGGGGGAYSSGASNFGSDDDCLTPTPLGNGDDQPPLFGASSASTVALNLNSDEYEKRSRLCPTQLFLGNGANSSQSASSSLRNSPIPLPLSSTGNSSTSLDDCYDLVELECSQSGSGGFTSAKISGGRLIGEGLYELVGDGRECKAVNVQTQTVYHCQILKLDEYKSFLNIMNRLKTAESFYDGDDLDKMQNVLVPDSVQPIRGEEDIWYILTPDHHGNLHTLIQTNYHTKFSDNSSMRIFSERRIQPIFKQIVALVKFCHKIGIYFRDFRLRKFVFTDRERTEIRLNNVLDLWVAPDISSDQMTQRHVCPAYVAPEILDVKTDAYAGRPADIWALGVLMFILLTNHYPFYDHNPKALFRRIYTRKFSFPVSEHISTNARWLLHGLLRLDPNDRPNAEGILNSHWLQADAECLPDGIEHCSPSAIKLTVPHGHTIGLSDNSSSTSVILLNNNSNSQIGNNIDGNRMNFPQMYVGAPRVIFERSNSHQPQQPTPQQQRSSGLRANRSVASFNEMRSGLAVTELSQQSFIAPINRALILAHNRHNTNQQQERQRQTNNSNTNNTNNGTQLRDQSAAALSMANSLAPLQQVSRASSPTATAATTSALLSESATRPVLAEWNNHRSTAAHRQLNMTDNFDQVVPEMKEPTETTKPISKLAVASNVTVAHYHHHQAYRPHQTHQGHYETPQSQAARRQRLTLDIGRSASISIGLSEYGGPSPSAGSSGCPSRLSPTSTILSPTSRAFSSSSRSQSRAVRVTGGP